MTDIIFLIIGLAAGFFAAWGFFKSRSQSEQSKLKIDLGVAQGQAAMNADELQKTKAGAELMRADKEKATNELSAVRSDNVNLKEQRELYEQAALKFQKDVENVTQELNALSREFSSEQAKNRSLAEENAKLNAKIIQLEKTIQQLNESLTSSEKTNAQLISQNKYNAEKLEKQKEEIEAIGAKFSLEFKNLASTILEDNSKKFTNLNAENLNQILKPLGDNIQDFRRRVDEVYDKESKERFSLERKIDEIQQASQKISADAINLTTALMGEAKTMGDWGEMRLDLILENSGLTKGREYEVQEYLKDDVGNILKNDAGEKLRPDVIVHFPDNRKIIIDAKVTLPSYTRFNSSDNKEVKKAALKELIKSIRDHINNLSSKNYQNFAPTLDLVFLFVPIEGAYILAMQNDRDLLTDAQKKRIQLISPANLIAILNIVKEIWKREIQSRNALEIAKKSGELYDKLVSFAESLEDIGKHLDKTQTSYNEALKKLKHGKGNLISKAEGLKRLGVKGKKELPSVMIEDADYEEENDTLLLPASDEN